MRARIATSSSRAAAGEGLQRAFEALHGRTGLVTPPSSARSRSSPKRPSSPQASAIPSVTTTSCWPGSTTGCARAASRRRAKAPSTGPGAATSATASPSTSRGGGWPATASADRLQRVLRDRQGGDAAERRVAAGEQGAVERRQRDQRVAGQRRRGAQRVAGLGGDRGGPGAAPGDVADHQHPATGRREGVVEVAADLVLGAGRPVGRRHRPAGNVRQGRRQQAVLEGLGDLRARLLRPLEVGEEAGVVERQRDPAGEHAGELRVGRGGSGGPTRRPRGSAPRSACLAPAAPR